MLTVLHYILLAAYVALPPAAVALALWRREPDLPILATAEPGGIAMPPKASRQPSRAARLASLSITFLAGFAVALSMCLIYGRAVGGHVPVRQVLLAAYFATGLLLLLRCFDNALLWGLRRAWRVHRPGPPGIARAARVVAALMTRALVLIVFGLPFVMAAIMTYRPRVEPADDPQSQLGYAFERVEFPSRDGAVTLSGWWIPATASPSTRPGASATRIASPVKPTDPNWGRRTVILCHGLGSSKSNQLVMGWRLVQGGLNVLAFDFRGHGQSGGQLTGYGALEKEDVLGAVRWLRQTRPAQAEKIFGVGASMGAVALIGAAADPCDDGRAIDAIATYAAYDDLAALTRDLAAHHFRPSLTALLEGIGLPLAGVHTGVNLARFRPADDVTALWPRPILYVHGQRDDIIPFERGRALWEATPQPRFYLWLPQGTHNDIVIDDLAGAAVLQFLRDASEPLPVL